MSDGASSSVDQSLLDRIRDQVEFYFSDSNILFDNHLRTKMSEHPEGFVSLEHIASFKRMQALTSDLEVVLRAIEKSEELVLSEDRTMVRRKNPLPEKNTTMERSIYAKGFPADSTLDGLIEFWKQYGNIRCVRMRRVKGEEQLFKGSVFVEFATEEEAKAATEKEIKFGEETLLIKSKQAYLNDKRQERKARRNASKGEEDEKEESSFKEGLILKLEGLGEETTREIIKANLGEIGIISFVDFSKGQDSGYVRFDDQESTKSALEAIKEKQLDFGGKVPEASIVEGEEEKEYWTKVASLRKGGKRGGNGKRNRGGGQGSKRGKR